MHVISSYLFVDDMTFNIKNFEMGTNIGFNLITWEVMFLFVGKFFASWQQKKTHGKGTNDFLKEKNTKLATF